MFMKITFFTQGKKDQQRSLRQRYRNTFYCDNEYWMHCPHIQIKKQKKGGMI